MITALVWNSRDGSQVKPLIADGESSLGKIYDTLTIERGSETTPIGKKRSLRNKSLVKPPSYLVADSVMRRVEDGSITGKKRQSRKREPSPSRVHDILIEEPAGKKTRCADAVTGGEKKTQFTGGRGRKLRSRGRRREIDFEVEVAGSESELTVKTPQGSRVCSQRPNTVPQNKKRFSTSDIIQGESDRDENFTGVTEEGGWRGRRRKSRVVDSKPRRQRSLSSTSRHKSSEESEEEYELSSDEVSSDSDGSSTEGEEEDPYTPARSHASSQKKARLKHCPAQKTPRTSRATKARRTPRQSRGSSKAPTFRTPAGKTPRSKVVVTPHIPQKKKAAGGRVGNLDKARLRYNTHVYTWKYMCITPYLKGV